MALPLKWPKKNLVEYSLTILSTDPEPAVGRIMRPKNLTGLEWMEGIEDEGSG